MKILIRVRDVWILHVKLTMQQVSMTDLTILTWLLQNMTIAYTLILYMPPKNQ